MTGHRAADPNAAWAPEDGIGSWRFGGTLANQVDQLHAVVDRLAQAQEAIRSDHSFLWRWADREAAPVIRFLRGASAALGGAPERPTGLAPLFNRVEALETGMAELAHELQRVCAALEHLSSLVAERPK